MHRLLFLVLILVACAACSSAPAAVPPAAQFQGLPSLGQLDSIKGLSAIAALDIPVTSPLTQANTAPNLDDTELVYTAPALDIAWAIWRVTPPEGQMLQVAAFGGDQLWLIVADYATGRWVGATSLAGATPSLDLTVVDGLISPGGYIYLAVVCPQAQSGSLEMLELMYDDTDLYHLNLAAANVGGSPAAVVLTWDPGIAEMYRIYRSTLPNDPAPVLIGETPDSSPGDNLWMDVVNADDSDDTWSQFEINSSTPDPADDYYMCAPEVRYYYHIVPYSGGSPLDPSPEKNIKLDWGSRRATRRALPDTTNQTRVFADQLLASSMTPAQTTWCASNLVGTQKILKTDADAFRATYPGFLVLGYHLASGAGEIGNVCGIQWSADADWYYVNQHEDWFIHPAGSTELNGRALQTDWNWYAADPRSAWAVYLGANLLQMLGENHFDGWFVDSASELWNTSPAQWWPDGSTMFSYWTPRENYMLNYVTTQAKAHPLQPYIIPNAGPYITTLSDIKYYGTDWACDGIMIEGHAHSSAGDYYSEADWALQHDRILDHQAHGLATILQTSVFTPDTADRLFVYGSYLLVRGARTYINWLGDDGLDTINSQIGQWYPEFDTDIDLGPPPAVPVATVVEMLTADGLYRRQLGQGFVLVNAGDTDKQYTCPYNMQKLTVTGGGNVNTAGEPQGNYAWAGINGVQTLPPHTALIILDILD